MLPIHCELLNHLLTTAWRELRQWLVNTLEWMKGLGIKWQDVLKEEQVVIEEGPAKPWQERNIMQSPCGLFLIFPNFMLCPYCSPSSTVVAHPFLLMSLTFCLPFSPCSISIVHFYTTRESCSLTSASDDWDSWDWTFLSSPIHMYSKQRDKSHPTDYRPHPPMCCGVVEELGEPQLFHQRRSFYFTVGDNNVNPIHNIESALYKTDTDIQLCESNLDICGKSKK